MLTPSQHTHSLNVGHDTTNVEAVQYLPNRHGACRFGSCECTMQGDVKQADLRSTMGRKRGWRDGNNEVEKME